MLPSPEEITRHHAPDPTINPWVHGKPTPEPIVIVDYDPHWPALFEQLAHALQSALGPLALSIEHVGSTSVPGLPAKPVIDIDLTVSNPADEAAYLPQLEQLGYDLTIREPNGHEHRCLRLHDPRVNLHVFGPNCPEVIRHRMFRDWLCQHPDDLALYEQAKRQAAIDVENVMVYNQRKQAVIHEIYSRMFKAAGLL
jgi:GrpB-like predicted nucleotidyltransferase (UPF0157 family)